MVRARRTETVRQNKEDGIERQEPRRMGGRTGRERMLALSAPQLPSHSVGKVFLIGATRAPIRRRFA